MSTGPTSIHLPPELVQRLKLKRNLLSIERGDYVSMSKLIKELITKALNSETIMEAKG